MQTKIPPSGILMLVVLALAIMWCTFSTPTDIASVAALNVQRVETVESFVTDPLFMGVTVAALVGVVFFNKRK